MASIVRAQRLINCEIEYNASPKLCNQCMSRMSYKQRKNLFCSSSCAATFNNSVRPPRTKQSKQKTVRTIKKYVYKKYAEDGAFCVVNFRKCKVCDKSTPNKNVCSKTCAGKVVKKKCNNYKPSEKTEAGIKKISEAMKKYHAGRRPKILSRRKQEELEGNCRICNTPIKKARKTCSDNCKRIYSSRIQSEYMRNNQHKYAGRRKASWMEVSFSSWLAKKNICKGMSGYLTEVYFWNPDTKKNGWADFVFPRKRLIIELDGSHHRGREALDNIRDKYLRSRGWNVIRVTYNEYQEKSRIKELEDLILK